MEAKKIIASMTELKNLRRDLEYFEGLLHAYDGDGKEGKEIRETLRGRIEGIRQDMKAVLGNGKRPINGKVPVNGKKPINGKSPISGTQVTLATDDAEEESATYSQESA